MLVAAAVVPQAPLLLPGATGGPIDEVDEVAAAARAAVAWVLGHDLDGVIALSTAPATRAWPPGTPAGTARHTGARASAGDVLPVGLAVLASLVPHAERRRPVLQSVARDVTAAEARALGERLAATSDRVGLLVAADGSARRGLRAPGYLDERAAAFDAAVWAALAGGDTAALLGLDAGLAEQLLAAGRAAWQVLAGAAQGRPVRAGLDYTGDPFGVAYVVARWAA